MAVSFCALTQRTWSCAIRLAIPVSSVSICFLILLIRLRLKDRNSAQLTCARRFLFCEQDFAQVPALCFVLTQALLLGREWWGWLRLHRCAKSGQNLCIDRVGLGEDAGGPRILPHPNGLHQGDCKIVLFQALQQRLLIAATGFTDQLHRRGTLFNPKD